MNKPILLLTTICMTLSLNLSAQDVEVKITPDLDSVQVTHEGDKIDIMRNQDTDNTISDSFAKTSRPCPPFCIQPMNLAPGVETIGEVEMLAYLSQKEAGDDTVIVIDSRTPDWYERGTIPDDTVIVIDSRTPDWYERGTIPGAMNLPWTALNPAKGADPLSIAEIMQDVFNVTESEGLFDYSNAKTAVMFCNGMWCGQSPNNIKNLLKFGYPAHKIKWYRGGMQDWEILGLTTVKPSA